jgi:hypothetical protein
MRTAPLLLLVALAPTLHAADPPPATLQRDGTNVTFARGNQTILRYNGDKTPLPNGYAAVLQRGGYLHPIYTPSGKLVSDDYPPNHKHHHGLWFAWTKTEFEGRHPDFWNMQDKKGGVEFVSLDKTSADGLTATHRYVDTTAKPDPKAALTETWTTTVLPSPANYFLFDVAVSQTCATDQPLVLPKYHYGGIAFRGHRDWNGPGDAATFLTSEGKDRSTGNETRARWVAISGKIDGQFATLAILDSPDNFRSPQPVRIHPDMPYFTFTPQQLGEFKIEPDKPYTARYRVVTVDGPPDKDLLNRLWTDYAQPSKAPAK